MDSSIKRGLPMYIGAKALVSFLEWTREKPKDVPWNSMYNSMAVPT